MDESDAVGLVYFSGLAIGCFNTNLTRFEATLLREQQHSLSVTIEKIEGGQVTKKETYGSFPSSGVAIEITGIGNPATNGFSTFEPGNFNRTGANDDNDLRWICDLEGTEFHNTVLQPTGVAESDYGLPLSHLYIKNAELYTKSYSPYDTNKVEKDADGTIVNETFFGKYGYKLGAKIIAEKINIKFTGVQIEELDLDQARNTVYKIYVLNEREVADLSTDFAEYYKVLKEPTGRNFDLIKVTDTGDYYCGMVFCRQRSSCNWT